MDWKVVAAVIATAAAVLSGMLTVYTAIQAGAEARAAALVQLQDVDARLERAISRQVNIDSDFSRELIEIVKLYHGHSHGKECPQPPK